MVCAWLYGDSYISIKRLHVDSRTKYGLELLINLPVRLRYSGQCAHRFLLVCNMDQASLSP